MNLTDEQIEKALHCCQFTVKGCKECPLDPNMPCQTNLHLAAADYIKRLKGKRIEAAEAAIMRFRNEFSTLIELNEKHPKTHCHFAHKIAGQEVQVPCFMLDTFVTLLGKVEGIIAGIAEPSPQAAEKTKEHDAANGTKVDGDIIKFYDGIITIICDDATEGKTPRAKKLYPTALGSPYAQGVTLNDCLKIIEFDGEGTVMVIFEEPLKGEIYEYGNYRPECWVKHGTTQGYA